MEVLGGSRLQLGDCHRYNKEQCYLAGPHWGRGEGVHHGSSTALWAQVGSLLFSLVLRKT